MSASRSMTSAVLLLAASRIARSSCVYVRTSMGAEKMSVSTVGASDGTGVGRGEGAGVAVGTNVAVGDGVGGQSLPAPRVPSSSIHITESYGALPLTVPNDQLISPGHEPLVKLSV